MHPMNTSPIFFLLVLLRFFFEISIIFPESRLLQCWKVFLQKRVLWNSSWLTGRQLFEAIFCVFVVIFLLIFFFFSDLLNYECGKHEIGEIYSCDWWLATIISTSIVRIRYRGSTGSAIISTELMLITEFVRQIVYGNVNDHQLPSIIEP